MSAQVYRMYDADGAVIYIGSTLNFRTRLHDHQNSKPWWQRVVRIEIAHYPTLAEARAAETQAQGIEPPEFGAPDRAELTRRSWLARRQRFGPNGYVPRPHYGGAS